MSNSEQEYKKLAIDIQQQEGELKVIEPCLSPEEITQRKEEIRQFNKDNPDQVEFSLP